ncbi:MAG: acyltransferase family protein [Deltaproteobacteria bacterium]|jgi:1-acyl-sn-glycerol-3-phosphate acyltransferase|nr:acyltransferase family protein [Deltaproteobacteria bacterium]
MDHGMMDDTTKGQLNAYLMLVKAVVRQYKGKLDELRKLTNEDCDEFGLSASFMEWTRPFFQFLYHQYFRVDTVGIKSIPAKSPAILVGNHSGTLPYDGTMSHMAIFNEHPKQRLLRFLVDDFVNNIPLVGGAIEKMGGIRASFDNATELLRKGHLVMIFPEGTDGIGKTYDEKYQLRPFDHAGFVRLAIKMRVPVIPVSIIGAEEIHPLIWKSKTMAEKLGVPYIPFTPTFPWLGPLGFIPLPTKWKIVFGKPIRYTKFKTSDARRNKLVSQEADKVRAIIQNTLDRELKKRKSIWE